MTTALNDGAKDWIADRIEIYEDDVRLGDPRLAAVRVSLPSDISFDSYDGALRSLLGPALPDDTEVVKSQAMVDALFEYPIRSDRSRFSIDPHYRLLGLRALTVLRFVTPDGAERALEFHDDPGLVRLDPRWFQAVRLFVGGGRPPHPERHRSSALPVLSGHSVPPFPPAARRGHGVHRRALDHADRVRLRHGTRRRMVSAAGRDPDRDVDRLHGAREHRGARAALRRRWLIAFGFGLVHGFGFSFALRDTMQLAGSHLLTSLLSFNLGVEIGQVAVLAVLLPALALLFRCRRRTARHDRPVGDRGAHRLALDDRSRRNSCGGISSSCRT